MKTLCPAMLLSVLVLPLATGCDKKVQLTFVNTTSQQLVVELRVPTQGQFQVGVAGPSGGKVRHDMQIDQNDLPLACSWNAGDQGGQFTIDKGTPKRLFVYIEPGQHVGPVDEKTEIQREKHTEIKDQIIEQHEVVE